MFWIKLRECKGPMLPQFFTSWRQIWQVHRLIAEDVNCLGDLEIPLQLCLARSKYGIFFKYLQKINDAYN